MTMNRVIHEAVRRDLRRLHAALGEVDDGDTARAGQLQRAFANLRRELTLHHEGEDQLIFPFLARVEDGVDDQLAAMEDEHQAMAVALARTDGAMTRYAATGSSADAAAARESVARTQEVVDRHLAHEETDVEPLVARHEDSPEWKAVEKQLRRRPAAQIGSFFAWLQDGMSDEGRTYLRSTVPPPVTYVFTRVGGRAYRRRIAPTWRSGALSGR
jgi:hemerythrin-like domain-containing protein